MTRYVFKRSGKLIVVELIIAGNDPNFTLVFEANLSRTGNMPAGMKRYFNPVNGDGFVEMYALKMDIFTESKFQNMLILMLGEVVFGAGTRVVGMCVGD